MRDHGSCTHQDDASHDTTVVSDGLESISELLGWFDQPVSPKACPSNTNVTPATWFYRARPRPLPSSPAGSSPGHRPSSYPACPGGAMQVISNK
eukprot:1379277-Pyramimonas_sp.AAC.1